MLPLNSIVFATVVLCLSLVMADSWFRKLLASTLAQNERLTLDHSYIIQSIAVSLF